MHFGNPQALWLLLLWPVLALLALLAARWRSRVARRLGSPDLLARLYPPSVRRWRVRRMMMGLCAMGLLMFAAARPQYGRVERSITTVGTNVVVALDTSRSMLANDAGSGTRIDAAKQGIHLLLRALMGNRVGILAFAGDAVLSCPMTTDIDLAGTILDSLDTDTVGIPGSDLGRAIEEATDAFERGAKQGGSRVLILITDGEDLEGRGLEAARKAASKGVRIFAVGIGSERGAPVFDEHGGFKEDEAGNKVSTRLDMKTLQAIANATGGAAFSGLAGLTQAIDQIVAHISGMQMTELEARKQIVHQDRFMWFLAPAMILLVWMLALRPEPTIEPEKESLNAERPAAASQT